MLLVLIWDAYRRLERPGYIWAGRGRIFRRKGGRIYRTRVTAPCPAGQCPGELRLGRMTVDEKVTYSTDANGNLKTNTKPVKQTRLVCSRNSDHNYQFDPTRMVDTP
jgi:hypothetical protein